MNTQENKAFFNFSAAMLLLTATAKLYSSGGPARILEVQDQLLHLGYRPLMVSSALLEMAAAVFLFRSRSDLGRCLAMLWLSANFLFYHLGNYLLGVHVCPCLGRLTYRLPLPSGLADLALKLLAFYWLVNSIVILWRGWSSAQWERVRLAAGRSLRRQSPRAIRS